MDPECMKGGLTIVGWKVGRQTRELFRFATFMVHDFSHTANRDHMPAQAVCYIRTSRLM